jgi:hypothetical protein
MLSPTGENFMGMEHGTYEAEGDVNLVKLRADLQSALFFLG